MSLLFVIVATAEQMRESFAASGCFELVDAHPTIELVINAPLVPYPLGRDWGVVAVTASPDIDPSMQCRCEVPQDFITRNSGAIPRDMEIGVC